MKNIAAVLVLVLAWGLFGSQVAHAQATLTWVSGVGDDANPCSRTAPCKTFAGAISKTAAGGTISVLDPGGFGAVTITKSMTINGAGVLTSIISSGTNGIRVQAGVNDVVVIRNLSINTGTSISPGLNGINYISGRALAIENVTIGGKMSGSGVEVAHTSTGNLTISDTVISGGVHGVRLTATTRLDAELRNVKITGSGNGVTVLSGMVSIHDSQISNSTGASGTQGAGVYSSAGKVSIEGTRLDNNTTALQVAGGQARLANSSFYNNKNGLVCTGGPITSAYDNRKGGNAGGVLTACPEPLPALTIL